jgi:endonuclease YncB( thermonuclease family)
MHDFKKFPELTNEQLSKYYFQSPHKQITRSFTAKVVKVTDGDTIRVQWSERDFDFPIRIANIAAPEKNEDGGKESQSWLEEQILGREVLIEINPNNRVGKWGRLIGYVRSMGMDVGEQSVRMGFSVSWEFRGRDFQVPTLETVLGSS